MWINSRFPVVTEKEILQMRTFPECVVLSPKLYMLIQLSSSISVNSGFSNIQLHSSHVNEYSAAIQLLASIKRVLRKVNSFSV